jgi:uncharacterized RDD family membrane protein YckC
MNEEFLQSIERPVPVDLDLQIETPENVALTCHLAGPSLRCAAWLIDTAARAVVLVIVSIICAIGAIALPGLSLGLLSLFLFALEFWYFTLCEYFFNGKTLGKKALGLRVVQAKGYPLTFFASALRNLLRVADSMPFLLHGVGFLTMVRTKKFQRLGDLAARTVVIAERRVVLPREPIILEKIEPLSRGEIGSYVPPTATLTMIDELLGRRYVLSHQRGHAIAAKFARALARKLSYTGDRSVVAKYPMAFLAKVYVTFLRTEKDDEHDERAAERPRPRARRRPAAAGRV